MFIKCGTTAATIPRGQSWKDARDCADRRARAKKQRERNEKRSAARVYATEEPEGETTTVSRRVAPITLQEVKGWWTNQS